MYGVMVVPMSATTITRKLRFPSMWGTTVLEPTWVHFGRPSSAAMG